MKKYIFKPTGARLKGLCRCGAYLFVFCLILAAVLGITGCESRIDPENPLASYHGEWVSFAENGTSDYTIVYSQTPSETDLKMAAKLADFFKENFDLDIKIEPDSSEHSKELLIGKTGRAESVEANKIIKKEDFIIGFYPDKIVITGGSDMAYEKAVDCFIDKFAKADGETKSLQIPLEFEYCFEFDYPVNEFTINGTDIADYTVFYTNGYVFPAEFLKEKVCSDTGAALCIKDYAEFENTSDSPCLIIGYDPSDSGVTGMVPENPLEYSVVYDGSCMRILSKTPLGTLQAMKDLFNAEPDNQGNICISDKTRSNTGVYEPSGSMISETPFGIQLENQHAVICLSENGLVNFFCNKQTGYDICSKEQAVPFCSIFGKDNEVILPDKLTLDGDILSAHFGEHILRIEADCRNDFFDFVLLDDITPDYNSIEFANFLFAADGTDKDPFTAAGFVVTRDYDNVYYMGDGKRVRALCSSNIPSRQNELLLVAAPQGSHSDIIKNVNEYIKAKRPSDKGEAAYNFPAEMKNKDRYMLVFNDDFNGDSLDTSKWYYRGSGKSRCGYAAPSQVKVENGNMIIKQEYLESDRGEYGSGWYAGMISSNRKYVKGYFEMRCICNEVHNGGCWSAFWLQANNPYNPDVSKGGPGGAEIDIIESYTDPKGNPQVSFNIHVAGKKDGNKDGLDSKNVATVKIPDCFTEYHTYGFEWTDECYTLYIDGEKIASSDWGDGVSQVDEEIIISLEFSDIKPHPKSITSQFVVDYVKVYRLF